jgi:pyridoxine 4-dehydrogenase
VHHIGTAQFYGLGTVNLLIGEALCPCPDGLTVVSKVGASRGTSDAVPH